ncbi:deoxynucleoside triphosphate triphosphohydrolase SAMHD1-like [Argonauta hians]
MVANFVINDSIHGSVELHPLCVKIINTVQFQRLRYIKQLGMGYFVFPGASHNRFEHSIGTCHLAGELLFHLRSHQPELNIAEKDILCVEIAALCHDLGHGPFSHFYDNTFIPEIDPNSQWKHEDASVKMLQHILDKNIDVKNAFDEEGLDKTDISFIKSLINPDYRGDTGRGIEKSYLYNIVANKVNGVDVDKWDYFARDCHHLGLTNYVDHKRLIKFARVLRMADGKREICFRDKTLDSFYYMFRSRLELHRMAYKHKAVIAISEMLKDAFVLSNNVIKRQGEDNSLFSVSEARNDMIAYTHLTDSVFDEILHSRDDELKPARDILIRILERKLYKLVGEKHTSCQTESENVLREIIPTEEEELLSNLVVCDLDFDYSRGGDDPVQNIHFYCKNSPDVVLDKKHLAYSHAIPLTFSGKTIQVFCKNDDHLDRAKELFNSWKERTQ